MEEPEGSLLHLQEPTTCRYPKPDQFSPCNPHHTSRKSILILSSHLCLGLPSGLFPSGFPTKTLYAPILSRLCATCSTHVILLSLITWIIFGEKYRSEATHYAVFSTPITSSLLGPNILNTLFSNTLSRHSSLSVGDQVSHPHKTTGKSIVLHILIFKFLDSKLEDKRFCTKW